MPFPDAPRVLYAINPLDEVVCEFRFPPILKIEAEPPAAFQELIRAEYPNYEFKQNLKLPPGIPQEIVRNFLLDMPIGGQKSHAFSSRDNIWKLTLNRQSLAMTCARYERWELFKERMARPFEALIQLYAPTFLSRLGLRYRDVIRRSRLGLSDVPWGQLLNPWLSGILGAPGMNGSVFGTQTVCGIQLPDEIGRVQLNYGIALEDRPGEDASKTEREEVFLIDSDFSVEHEMELSDAFNRLNSLNRQSSLLFHWSITERLHAALQPVPIPPI